MWRLTLLCTPMFPSQERTATCYTLRAVGAEVEKLKVRRSKVDQGSHNARSSKWLLEASE